MPRPGPSPAEPPSPDLLVERRLRALGPRARGALYAAVRAAEAEVALFHRRRAGAPPVPHPIALTPFIVPRRALPLLRALADAFLRLQAHAPRLYRDLPTVRRLCPVSEATERWLAEAPAAVAPWALMIRPDLGLTRSPAGLTPIVFETNATALAGLYNHTAGVRILRRVVLPRLLAPAEARGLADPPDLLGLTVRWVTRAARRLDLAADAGVALVEAPGPVDGYSELPRLAAAFRAAGLRAVLGSPEDLRVSRGHVRLRDTPVALVYRDLACEDVGSPATGGRRLAGFLDRFRAGAVLPGAAGEFAHKGLLEVLTRAEVQGLFTPSQRRLLRACVPWTRVLTARRTEGPRGQPVDLPEFVRRHRVGLVVKPNVGSSGDGLLLGAGTRAARWEARIERALREPGQWVVQLRRSGLRRPMTYLRAGRAHHARCYSSLGLFYAPGDLGLHCRVSRAPVVNVARQGALACAFLTG